MLLAVHESQRNAFQARKSRICNLIASPPGNALLQLALFEQCVCKTLSVVRLWHVDRRDPTVLSSNSVVRLWHVDRRDPTVLSSNSVKIIQCDGSMTSFQRELSKRHDSARSTAAEPPLHKLSCSGKKPPSLPSFKTSHTAGSVLDLIFVLFSIFHRVFHVWTVRIFPCDLSLVQ